MKKKTKLTLHDIFRKWHWESVEDMQLYFRRNSARYNFRYYPLIEGDPIVRIITDDCDEYFRVKSKYVGFLWWKHRVYYLE